MTIIIYNKEKFNETYAEIYNVYFSKELSNVYSNKKNIKIVNRLLEELQLYLLKSLVFFDNSCENIIVDMIKNDEKNNNFKYIQEDKLLYRKIIFSFIILYSIKINIVSKNYINTYDELLLELPNFDKQIYNNSNICDS